MILFANLETGCSASPGLRITFRKHKRFACLAILFAFLTPSLGCGLIGGGAAAEEESAAADRALVAETIPETLTLADAGSEDSEATEADGQPETEADPQAEAAADPKPEAEPEAEPAVVVEPAAAAVDSEVDDEAGAGPETAAEPILVQDAELARDLAWAHLSQCVTLNSSGLEATLINADWFIAGSAEATRTYGFWKVDAITGAVTPYGTLSRQWQAALDSQCSPASVEALV